MILSAYLYRHQLYNVQLYATPASQQPRVETLVSTQNNLLTADPKYTILPTSICGMTLYCRYKLPSASILRNVKTRR